MEASYDRGQNIFEAEAHVIDVKSPQIMSVKVLKVDDIDNLYDRHVGSPISAQSIITPWYDCVH